MLTGSEQGSSLAEKKRRGAEGKENQSFLEELKEGDVRSLCELSIPLSFRTALDPYIISKHLCLF
jgi:hypothetical protein